MSFIPKTVTLKNGELITITVRDIAEAPKLAELKRSYFFNLSRKNLSILS